jgi:transcriptional regulator with XRE-family HTH domain
MAGTKELDEPTDLGPWLLWRLQGIHWMQKNLATAADVSTATISELISGKQKLTAEMAEKLAAVPELKTTKEALLRRGGVWQEIKPTRKSDLAGALFDQLSNNGQDLVIDFMVMLAQRERERERNKG